MKTWEEFEVAVIGKTVIAVDVDALSDEGFVLIFDNGARLVVGWSGCEGRAELNGVNIKL